MGQHTDALGSYENFQAPWETAAGEVEIDKDRLKRYIYNLVSDKAKAQDARDESVEEVTKAKKELEDAKAEVAKGDTNGTIAGLESKLAAAEKTAKDAQLALDRLEVGIEKGLTPKQAARLQGENREALEKDADEILVTFGVKKTTTEEDPDEDNEDEDEEDPATGLRQTPRLVNAGDPKLGKPDAEPDYEKIADSVLSRRF